MPLSPISLPQAFSFLQTQCVVFLDYDGTLTPIVKSPELALLPAERAEFLEGLSSLPNTVWAIVTGRTVGQIQGFFADSQLKPDYICGLHGGEIFAPKKNEWILKPDASLNAISDQFMMDVEARLKAVFSTDDITTVGLALEPKGYSFALHYRACTDDAVGVKAHQIFDAAYAVNHAVNETYRLQPGKRVVEIVPNTFNKGDGIRFLLKHIAQAYPMQTERFAVFMGDDKTDEPGFVAVNESGGVSVRVALPDGEPTDATVQVADVDDVYGLLAEWVTARQLAR